jgi:hypothetical protein
MYEIVYTKCRNIIEIMQTDKERKSKCNEEEINEDKLKKRNTE